MSTGWGKTKRDGERERRATTEWGTRWFVFVSHVILCSVLKWAYLIFQKVVGRVGGVRGICSTKSMVVTEQESARLLKAAGGKVAIVTGANTGIGLSTALHLVRRGVNVVVLACRSMERGEQARRRIMEELGPTLNMKCNVEVMHLDLSDLESVRKFAVAFLRRHSGRLDILVNNAGVPSIWGKTKQGYSLTFGVNVLGPWLLTHLLFPAICTTPNSRVVNLSSVTHYYARTEDLEEETLKELLSKDGPQYGLSKFAMVLLTVELRRKFQLENSTATSIAVDPGAVCSDIWRYFKNDKAPLLNSIVDLILKASFITPDQGCIPSVAAATLPLEDIGYSTIYLQPYWLPYGISPLFETNGYYVGWEKAQPLLTRDYKSRATVLWNTCEALLTDWCDRCSLYSK